MGFECRCACHPHTQQLVRKGPGKPDPKGGIRRRLPKQIADAIGALPEVESVPEVHNTCPKCGAKAKATDQFCRKDGTRLALGKQCLGCGAPGDPDDAYCWNCALKHGEKPQEKLEIPEEDPLVRVLREVKEQGLLKETAV